MFYSISETLIPAEKDEAFSRQVPFVAVLTPAEWREQKDSFDMGIELDPDSADIYTTKAEVNYDSLTGTFALPDRAKLSGDDRKFAFALDEKGIVFIDESGVAASIIDTIRQTKRWRMPGLERFLYDFLDQIVKDDLRVMEKYETELVSIEENITEDDPNIPSARLNEIRSDIRYLLVHYEQLMDLAQELEENENGFFRADNLRYFHLFLSRMERLHATASSLRDYTMQIRDLYQAHLDIKQNRIMTLLTVVTTIFMPLTLIAGWYGMNFRYMPELNWKASYPAVFLVSVLIVIWSLHFFKKKKWM